MELRHLRYFVVVAEEMNMHRAAARLHISQPPLSLAVRQLEEDIGAALFTREGRGIQITRAGEAFLKKARKILEESHQATEEARQIDSGKTGTLKIGFISSAVTGILQQSVAAFRQSTPDVVLTMEQGVAGRIEKELLAGNVDVGIVRIPHYHSNEIAIHEITREAWVLALPTRHPLTRKKEIRFSNLAGHPLIFYPRWNGPASYDDVMGLFKKHDVMPNIVQEAPEQMTIAGLVAAQIGIGIVPACMAKIKVAGITHKPLAGTKNKTGFAFLTRKEEDSLVKSFLSTAKDAMKDGS